MKTELPRPTPRPRTTALDFAIWMVEHGMGVKDVARALDCHVMAVSNWKNNHSCPRRDLAVKLEELTGGRISAASWDEKRSANGDDQ